MRLLFFLFVVSAFPAPAQNNIRDQYNATYADPAEETNFNHAPNAFLVDFSKDLKPGKAPDVGMGQGRNAIYLAQHGWDTTGIDLSDVGVRSAQNQAKKSGVNLKAIVVDAHEFDFGTNQWDLILFCYVPLSGLVDRVRQGLRPGGVVLVENFHQETGRIRLLPGGLADNELLHVFPDFRILRYEDKFARQDWGTKLADLNRIVRLAAQKPKPPEAGCVWQGKPYAEGATACWEPLWMRCEPKGWVRTGPCSP